MDVNGLVVGDKSSHGGVIITGDPIMTIGGKPVARIGDLHSCPQFYPTIPPIPHAVTPIIAGKNVPTRTLINGVPAAVEGDLTVCGATLFASMKLSTMIAIGSLAILGFAAMAALIKNSKPDVTNQGNIKTPTLTDVQISMIDSKVLDYDVLYHKIADVPAKQSPDQPPNQTQNCNCK